MTWSQGFGRDAKLWMTYTFLLPRSLHHQATSQSLKRNSRSVKLIFIPSGLQFQSIFLCCTSYCDNNYQYMQSVQGWVIYIYSKNELSSTIMSIKKVNLHQENVNNYLFSAIRNWTWRQTEEYSCMFAYLIFRLSSVSVDNVTSSGIAQWFVWGFQLFYKVMYPLST